MTIHSRPDPGWIQFERMVLGGVPHALNIAVALNACGLTIPNSPHFDSRDVDLAFYGPVHHAYRLQVLTRFLSIMEALRPHPLWRQLQVCRMAQLAIVDECSSSPENEGSILERQDRWFQLAEGSWRVAG